MAHRHLSLSFTLLYLYGKNISTVMQAFISPIFVKLEIFSKKKPQGSSKFYALTQNFDSLCLLKLEEFSSKLKNPGYLFSGEKNGEKKPAVK